MTFGSYRISTIFLMLAIVFFVMAITLENSAFIGSVVVCLIFGAKKVKDVPKK
ncbi:hypothetical protein LU290_06935 [Moraxella nasibovis]|uniref:hypothetical protein n=1 Tax=Moraxella nasibovis TaxID=2904120 RepID=UPI00241034CA|nr:hypothetical protein [Moraxella nasibovis]WFF37992.1 hypothetical protein LU290_06935 [Moraxella nasibovis]